MIESFNHKKYFPRHRRKKKKKFFELHDYTKNMKARIAIFGLKRKAEIWWEYVKPVRDIET